MPWVARHAVRAVTDLAFYGQVARQPAGRTLAYLLVLCLVLFLFGGLQTLIRSQAIVAELVTVVEREVPDFRLDRGRLTVEGPQPYVIDGGDFAIVVDTQGRQGEAIFADYPSGFHVTAAGITVKDPGRLRTFRFSALPDVVFTRQSLLRALPPLSRWLPLLAIPWYGLYVLEKLVESVLLGVVGLVAARSGGVPCGFGQTWTIATYALTGPVVAAFLRDRLDVGIPGFGLFYGGLAVAYVLAAISREGQRAAWRRTPEPQASRHGASDGGRRG